MIQSDVCEKILIHSDDIQMRVSKIGEQITKDYQGKEIILISVLNGSFMFTSDLAKNIDLECKIDFMQISTYGNSTTTNGQFVIKKDLSQDICGKHVVVVEDIIDSGNTISKLIDYLHKLNPSSIKVATLIDKPARRIVDVEADYVGFKMDDDYFIVGYGLDYAQKYRNLPYIGVLKEHIYSNK